MSFFIDGQTIKAAELNEWAHEDGQYASADWIKELAVCIMEWYDDSPSISIHTSGSTGIPKKIRHTKVAMEASAIKTGQRFDLRSGMTTLHCLPARYIAGKMMLIRAIVLGLEQVCIAPKLALKIPEGQTDQDLYHFAAMTPMQLGATLTSARRSIDKIKTIILGGAPIPPSLLDQIQSLPVSCFATYGMTETITHIATTPLNGIARSDVFEALEGVSFTTTDGNLVIEADHLTGSPLTTTDQVDLIDRHHFRWLGRNDHVINQGGLKIHPAQVEKKLGSAISDPFIIAGAPDPISGQKVVLIIESKTYPQAQQIALRQHFQRLPKLERPKEIFFVDQFQRTPTGKIIRNADLYILRKSQLK